MSDILVADDYIRLLTSYHRNREKLGRSIEATLKPLLDTTAQLLGLSAKYDLDAAEGEQLDGIGRWVGVPRVVPNVIPLPYFGFQGQPEALTWGELGNPAVGGFWRESGVSGNYGAVMDDATYRTVIRAQIYRNHCTGSIDDAYHIVSMITELPVHIQDHLNMRVEVTFPPETDLMIIELVRMLFPRPAGVELLIKEEVLG